MHAEEMLRDYRERLENLAKICKSLQMQISTLAQELENAENAYYPLLEKIEALQIVGNVPQIYKIPQNQ